MYKAVEELFEFNNRCFHFAISFLILKSYLDNVITLFSNRMIVPSFKRGLNTESNYEYFKIIKSFFKNLVQESTNLGQL